MTQKTHSPCAAAMSLQAQPCLNFAAAQDLKTPIWNDTPDAMCHCAACGPQSQYWRGFAPTTALREADHGQTTTRVTH